MTKRTMKKYKKCKRCNKSKLVSGFKIDARRINSAASICKECARLEGRASRILKKDPFKALAQCFEHITDSIDESYQFVTLDEESKFYINLGNSIISRSRGKEMSPKIAMNGEYGSMDLEDDLLYCHPKSSRGTIIGGSGIVVDCKW